ncbi:MAG: hypothetical protein J6I85_03415 [Clostridia bacterium]|nr:hypothetical protein [Clostridia bacterium]
MAKKITIITIRNNNNEFNYIPYNIDYDNFHYRNFKKKTGLENNYINKIVITSKQKDSTENQYLFKTDDNGDIKSLSENEIAELIDSVKRNDENIIVV